MSKCCGGGCGALTAAFREITLALSGVFRLHDAEPDLVESSAEALRQVFRGQLERSAEPASGHAQGPMEALLDELDAATGAGN